MRSKERVKWAQVRVVAVVVAATSIFGVLVYLLTGGLLFADKTSLYLYVPDSTGIGLGSPVRVNGILVGKVEAVGLSGSFDPKRVVRIQLTIQSDSLAMIPVGSYAEFGAESMVGDKFVDVTSRGRGPTPPNSELPYQEPTDFFKTLDFSQFEKNMRQMESVLDDIEAGRGLVGQFVTGIELYRDVRGQLLDLERAFRAAASTTGSFGREVYTERLYRQLLDPLTEFDQALARLQSGQGAGRLLTETGDYDKAIATVRDLRGSIATLRDSSFIKSDEMYGNWTALVNRLARSVDEINSGPMFGAPQSYESLNGFARELEETMRDFRGNPRKYLRIKMF